ncbi:MAG: hypothetical protein IPO69_09065 [Saprospiraceae bacterium]|nr:hypothetical protein [Saprospiraceae bacterium]
MLPLFIQRVPSPWIWEANELATVFGSGWIYKSACSIGALSLNALGQAHSVRKAIQENGEKDLYMVIG